MSDNVLRLAFRVQFLFCLVYYYQPPFSRSHRSGCPLTPSWCSSPASAPGSRTSRWCRGRSGPSSRQRPPSWSVWRSSTTRRTTSCKYGGTYDTFFSRYKKLASPVPSPTYNRKAILNLNFWSKRFENI